MAFCRRGLEASECLVSWNFGLEDEGRSCGEQYPRAIPSVRPAAANVYPANYQLQTPAFPRRPPKLIPPLADAGHDLSPLPSFYAL